MCVIFYALDPTSNPEYTLVIASNRDEFLSRPTLPASWHSFDSPSSPSSSSSCTPHILSARDATGGGTWLGITRAGAFATLTNFTEVSAPLPDGLKAFESRGRLVRDWLANADWERKGMEETREEIERYLVGVRGGLDRYPGFNLLVGAVSTEASVVGYITNRHPNGTLARDANPHIFTADNSPTGLSNSVISEPWSKVISGSSTFNTILATPSSEDAVVEHLFDLLWTSSIPKPSQRSELRNSVLISPLQLPALAVDKDWYATRTSTVILVRKDGTAKFVERDTFRRQGGEAVLVNGPQGSGALDGRKGGQRVFEWRLD